VVGNDWTVRYRNGFLQLGRDSGVSAKQQVLVCEQLDGRVRLFAGDRELTYGESRTEPTPSRERKRAERPIGELRTSQENRPPADHSWRRPALATRAAALALAEAAISGEGACSAGAAGGEVDVSADSGAGAASVATLPARRQPPLGKQKPR
jgi:hypothetical protein